MIIWLRRRFKASPLIAFYLSILMVAPQYPAQAAPVYGFTAVSNRCINAYASEIYGSRYIVNRTTRITAILAQIGSASTTNFPSSKFHIRADSGTAGAGAILETFTPSNATAGVARFVGSRTVTAGTKFWVTPGQSHSVLGGCYGQPIPSADISGDGSFTLDSVTGLSTVYYIMSNNGGASFAPTGSSNFLFQIGIEISGEETSTITVSGISPNVSPLIYKSSYTLTATLSTPGKTTFYAQGKTIPGCKNIAWAGTTATCTWKPALHGAISIYATLRPTDSNISSSTSPTRSFGVDRRSTSR